MNAFFEQMLVRHQDVPEAILIPVIEVLTLSRGQREKETENGARDCVSEIFHVE
jgi:hypothetical protein